MSSEPQDVSPAQPSPPVRTMLIAAAVVLALLSALTTGPAGLWRLAGYPFDIESFWPEALKTGDRIARLPAQSEPRWVMIGSSIVLYGLAEDVVQATLQRPDGIRPSVTKLAIPQIIFSDAVILTQVAHRRAPVDLVLIGVHPRIFDIGTDPRTTLTARTFDDIGIQAEILKGGSPARRFERTLARVWPAFRLRHLEHRVTHAFLPTDSAASDIEADLPRVPGYKERPPEGRYDTVDDSPQLAELRPWIRWCLARDIQPVLVYFPEEPNAGDAVWSRDLSSTWNNTLAAICRDEGATYLNGRDVILASRFFDFNHLGREGAVEFSAWLGHALSTVP